MSIIVQPAPSIVPLSPRTVCCLRKGCSLWCPWHCVKELVCNSIDAGAASVAVRLDLDIRNIRIQVVDDGRGMSKAELVVVGRQFWTSKIESRGQALASVRRVAKLVSVSSRIEGGRTCKIEFVRGRRGGVEREGVDRTSSGTTVTVSGFLWNQEVRRRMVKEVADVMEVRNGLLAIALVHPMVRFSLRNDTEGRRETMLNTPRVDSAAQVFCGVFGSKLGDSVREVKCEDKEEQIRIAGFLCMEPHHSRDLQFISVNKQTISTCELHKEVQNLFRKVKTFQDWKSSIKTFPVFALQLEMLPDNCDLMLEQRKTLVMFKHKAKVLKVLTITVQQFLSEQGLTSPPPSTPSPHCVSPCMSGVKPLPPTQSLTPTTSISTTKLSQFLFSPGNPDGRTSCPAYRRRLHQASKDIFHVENTFDLSPCTPGQDKTSPRHSTVSSLLPSPPPDQDFWSDNLESNRSFQEIFMDIEIEEEEDLPDYVMSFSGEDCRESSHLPPSPPPSLSPQSTPLPLSPLVPPTSHPLSDEPPSPIVWSNHNFVFHKSPLPLVLTKSKDSGLKLEHGMVGECQLIGQVEDKYLATVSGGQLVVWDQHAVHERIRLEEMVMSSLTPGHSHTLRTASLECPLLASLPSQDEITAVLSRPGDCERWGLGLVGTEDTTSILVMDIPHCFSCLDTAMQVQLCQALLLELSCITMSKMSLPTFPRTVLDHLATQACRGAIMFGQILPLDSCRQLLHDLAQCKAPFQCAHGRPSVAVLCEMDIAREVGEWGRGKPNWKRVKHVRA